MATPIDMGPGPLPWYLNRKPAAPHTGGDDYANNATPPARDTEELLLEGTPQRQFHEPTIRDAAPCTLCPSCYLMGFPTCAGCGKAVR